MNRLGFFSVVALLALRLCIGWHFYKEGSDKVRSGSFSASGFLGGATGPLAGMYHGMVWDRDGEFRLDVPRTVESWHTSAIQIERAYGFSAEQKEAVQKALVNHEAQLKHVLETNASDLEEFKLGRERVQNLETDPFRSSVASLRGQNSTIESEWRRKGAPSLKQIDQVWTNLEESLNSIATAKQRRGRTIEVTKPRLGFVDTTVIDKVIPYFDLAIGISLILGLFVRPMAIAGGLFLVSVVLSQFPGWPGAQPTYYQAIEAIGMFVLAATAAGQFAGLDFILYGLWNRRKAKAASRAPAKTGKPVAA